MHPKERYSSGKQNHMHYATMKEGRKNKKDQA